jgi:hypothetical protein
MPIFQSNCSIGGTFIGLCHGDPAVTGADEPGGQRQYFGPQIEAMNLDPCVRGDFGNCGSTMPLPLTGITITLLSQADRDLICNWIVQGAPNN